MSSLMAQRIIFSTHTHSGAELIVLCALAWHADDSGVVSKVSVPALALLSRLSEKQTSRVLKKLTCSGAISVKSGRGRGYHSGYELNPQIFNKTKRSVEYKGGVIEVFTNAALDVYLAAASKRLIDDGHGDLLMQNIDRNQALSRSEVGSRPILKNSLQRRISRARAAEIKRLAEAALADAEAFLLHPSGSLPRFPSHFPVPGDCNEKHHNNPSNAEHSDTAIQEARSTPSESICRPSGWTHRSGASAVTGIRRVTGIRTVGSFRR